METVVQTTCTAFEGKRIIASGTLVEVARAVVMARSPVLIFDDLTGESIEVDLRGTPGEVLARLAPASTTAEEPVRGPGRPKLGVVGAKSPCCRVTGNG